MSLRLKVMLLTALLVVLIITGVTTVSILDTREAEITNNERYVQSELEVSAGMISTFINESIKITEDLARVSRAAIEEGHFQEEMFNNMLRNTLIDHDQIYGIWLRLEDGKYLEENSSYQAFGAYDPYFYREGDEIEMIGLKEAGWLENEEDGAFYYDAYRSGEIHVYEPVIWDIDGEEVEMVTIAYPIIVDGKKEGAIAIDITIEFINEYIGSLSIFETGSYALTYDGTYESDNYINSNEVSIEYALAENLNWKVFVDIPKGEMLDYKDRIIKMAGVGGVAILVAIFLIGLLFNTILSPITKITEKLKRIADFNLNIENTKKEEGYLNRKDEIGEISRAMEKMVENLIGLVEKISDQANQLASSSEELTDSSAQVSDAALEVGGVIGEIAKGATSQAEDTEKGAQRISDMGVLVESDKEYRQELNQSTKKIDDLKEEGFLVIDDLVQKTIKSNEVSQEVGDIIHQTNVSAEAIEIKSRNIKDIAEQTNLLALNASIEAARAGEAGRGFAVVADEIRKLAENSNSFTGEIDTIIKELTERTEYAVNKMDEVGAILKEQSADVESTSVKFEGIAEAIKETLEVLEKLNGSGELLDEKKNEIIAVIDNLSAISEENAASTEEATASVDQQTNSMKEISKASEELSKLAEKMQESIAVFTVQKDPEDK